MTDLDFRLYLVTDRRQTAGRPLLSLLEHAFQGGVRAVQLREKDLSTRALLGLAADVLELARRYDARLLINDRLDVALAVEADGVQLRADSLPVRVARQLLGPRRLIGVSTHSVADVHRAHEDGADFALLGPIFDTPSKRDYGSPLGLALLKEATGSVPIPIFGIGGIGTENTKAVREAGAFGVAVISSILTAPDVQRAARNLLDLVQRT